MMLKWVAPQLPYRTPGFLALRLFPSPTCPSTTHRTTGEMSERGTWSSANWTLYAARGMRFVVREGSTIG